MVATPYQPALTLGGYAEPPTSPERQEALDKADAGLPPEVRERYPVVSREEIKSRYPDAWIALLPTHVDGYDRMSAGRLVAHAGDRAEFAAELRRFRESYSRVFLHIYFTGRHPLGRDVVYV